MSKLPQVKPAELMAFFHRQGFMTSRQVGSHARLTHSDGRKITIALHNKPIASGTLQSILRQANMERIVFLKLFRK